MPHRLSCARRTVVAGVAAFAAVATLTTIFVSSAQAEPNDLPLNCGTVPDADPADAPQEVIIDTVSVGDTWAGHYVGQSMVTDGDDQYVAYYGSDRVLTVAHRKLDSHQWTKQQLTSTIDWDSHNYITVKTDREGNLHVAGNMHNDELRYWRTTTPGDVTTLQRVAHMTNPELESSVTYPVFLRLQDGTLVFRYREGSSGNGVDIYNAYDEATDQWRALLETPVLDGEGERNAYAAKPRLGPDGDYHMVWVWRETGIASTSNTVSYAKTTDLISWSDSADTPEPLPITRAESDAVDPVPVDGGVINNNVQVGFDADGQPVVAYHKYDEDGNTQVYVARPDDSEDGWQRVQVSDWTGAWDFSQPGTLVFEVEIYWAPELTDDGNLRLDVTCHGDARTFVIDGQSLEPIEEIASPPTVPDSVAAVRSDYEHPPADENGTEMQVNLNDDSGDAGSFHARRLLPQPGETRRDLLRWESLGENQDRPRATWPDPQPLEVVVLGTKEACKNGGWRTFHNPGFRNQGECVRHVVHQLRERRG
ncbi:BNR repeat-containing protein [Haloactinopolyspora sp.]|uniref:BNR repeat-containing protein n=1 Tax=Haloactinopolyspora sp. TaxID=1966353 RepID=UPI00262780C4|nr:BNR repeat-containing protein [Haloactinopolyspora sp.]